MSSEPRPKPLANFLLFCTLFAGTFAVIGGAIIALMSKANFFVAAGWVLLFFAIILIPTTIWIYLIEPQLKSGHKAALMTAIGVIGVAAFIFVQAGGTGGDTWSGQGQVDLFPQGSVSKNYVVTADIKATSKWWWRNDYAIQSITWPDGESDGFSGNCVVHGSGVSTCETIDSGETYTVSVTQAPDQPDDNQQ